MDPREMLLTYIQETTEHTTSSIQMFKKKLLPHLSEELREKSTRWVEANLLVDVDTFQEKNIELSVMGKELVGQQLGTVEKFMDFLFDPLAYKAMTYLMDDLLVSPDLDLKTKRKIIDFEERLPHFNVWPSLRV